MSKVFLKKLKNTFEGKKTKSNPWIMRNECESFHCVARIYEMAICGVNTMIEDKKDRIKNRFDKLSKD